MRDGFDRYINPTGWDIGIGVFVVALAIVIAVKEALS